MRRLEGNEKLQRTAKHFKRRHFNIADLILLLRNVW